MRTPAQAVRVKTDGEAGVPRSIAVSALELLSLRSSVYFSWIDSM